MPDRKLHYRSPVPMSRDEVASAIARGTPNDVEDALVSTVWFEKDLDYALSLCIRHSGSMDSAIRGTAILCLGHLARIHQCIFSASALELVSHAMADPDPYVRGQAENAADDIEMFVPSHRGYFGRPG